MSAFALFCVLSAGLFSLYAFVFAYTVEDHFFATMLEQQAQRHQQYFVRHGRWPITDQSDLQVYSNVADMPLEIRDVLELEPGRNEIAGQQGRHYHLLQMNQPLGAPAWLVAEVSSKLVFRRMRGTVWRILGYSTLGLLLSAMLMAWYLARVTVLPISRLSATLATLKPNQLPVQIPQDDSLSELGVLTRGVNELIQRVREFVQREQEFTRDVSHELRTPLTVISCAAQQLLAQSQSDCATGENVQLILRSSAQLQQTVHTLLLLAREENANAEHGTCRILPLLERVVVEQSSALGEKDVQLTIAVHYEHVASIHETVLHLVLSNLIGNAFSHCDSPSKIEIGAGERRIYIRNQTAFEFDAALIDAFQKRSSSPGFGLGLAIVQRLSDRFALDLQLVAQSGWFEASFALEP